MSAVSLGIEPLPMISALQAYGAKKSVQCKQGCAQIVYQPFQAQQASGNLSNIGYQINVPSLSSGVDKLIINEWTCEITVNGTNLIDINNVPYITTGLADHAQDQIINTEQVQIGSKSNTTMRSMIGVELARINNSSNFKSIFGSGEGTSYADFATSFQPWVNTNRDPLGSYYDQPVSDQIVDTRLTSIWIVSKSATAITYRFHIYFPLVTSPFTCSDDEEPAIRNLTVINITHQLESNLARLLSVRNNNLGTTTITAVTNLNFINCQVWVRFVQPSNDALMHLNPASDLYPYHETFSWITPAINIASGSTAQIPLPNIQFTVVPELLLLCPRPQLSTLGINACLQPRFYLPIVTNGLNVYWNTTQFLNGVNQRQLYNLCLEAGIDCTFEQFIGQDVTYDQSTGYVKDDSSSFILGGNIVAIDPSNVAQLSALGITNGTLANTSLTGSITVFNQTAHTINTELCIIAIYPGWLVSNGVVQASIGTLSISETKACFQSPEQIPMVTGGMKMHKRTIYGGGWFSNLFHKVKKVGSDVFNFLNKHKGSIVQGIETGAKLLGGGKAMGGRAMNRKISEYMQ